MSDILKQIVANKQLEVDQLAIENPIDKIRNDLQQSGVRSHHIFFEQLNRKNDINIIAEIKKGSPSKGILVDDFKPAEIAKAYQAGGAAALSVLTDSKFFFGSWEYLRMIREITELPILCKEFIIDPYQIYYARLMGADAVLLITSLHTESRLREFIGLSDELGMDCLVEVHDEAEVECALAAGARIVGVNNRNLKDFSVSIENSIRLAKAIPEDVIKVSESGIFGPDEIRQLSCAGYHCFLIGQALVTSNDSSNTIRQMRNTK